MSRNRKSALWILSLGLLAGVPVAAPVFASPAVYHGESGRARAELDAADRAWRCAVDELNRARAALDATRGSQAALASQVDSIGRSIPALRRNVEVASGNLYRTQSDLARVQAIESDLKHRVEIGDQRIAGARQYADGVRAKLIADFESGREVYAANADLGSATARLEQARNTVIGYVESTPRGRSIRSEIRRLEEEMGYLQARRPVDRRRVESAERALGEARRDMDQLIGGALASDLAVREANIAVSAATRRLDDLRSCFERDLPRRRELVDAYANVEREERALAGARAQLADACRQAEGLRAEVDRHGVCVADASRQLQSAESDFARASHELNGLSGAIAVADAQVRRANDVECAARAGRERAANRVAYLDRRIDDHRHGPRFEINVQWDQRGREDRRDDRHTRDDKREARDDRREDKRDSRGDSGIRDRREDARDNRSDSFRPISISRR